jgi:mannose-6-phosphate isomerase
MQALKKIDKPWGHELLWARTDGYAAKILHVTAGHKLSLQYHERKDETIFLYAGRMLLVLENEQGALQEMSVGAGEAYHIAAGRRHRMVAIDDCVIFEVSTNDLDDVVRIEDAYGRATPLHA